MSTPKPINCVRCGFAKGGPKTRCKYGQHLSFNHKWPIQPPDECLAADKKRVLAPLERAIEGIIDLDNPDKHGGRWGAGWSRGVFDALSRCQRILNEEQAKEVNKCDV